MPRRTATQSKKTRMKSPSFLFGNRALRDEPARDTSAERRKKDRAIRAWMKANAVKKLPSRKVEL